ncbi:MAG: NUDIX domain-containing protein [Candidatus Nanohaloarchaea archaeon]
MTDKTDVAQLVIRRETDLGYRYFLARRTKDGYWEWIGGKEEEGETIQEAAIREMREELRIDWREGDYRIVKLGDTYLSEDNDMFRLNPVLIELEDEKAGEIERRHLSEEHDDFAWINLVEYDRFETLGQYLALENLDLVNGDVAIGVVENLENGKYLAVKRSEENSSAGYWSFVSGELESGEDPGEAAEREVEEETGIEAEVVETGEFYIGRGETGSWRLFPVLLQSESKKVELNWELSDCKWIEVEELEDLETLGRMKAVEKLELGQ